MEGIQNKGIQIYQAVAVHRTSKGMVINVKENLPVPRETYEDSVGKNLEGGIATSDNAKVGSARFLIELENRRSIKVFGKSTIIGLGITFFAGVCFSLFSPAFNHATNDQWDTLKDGVPHLSVYTAFFWFSVSCFVVARRSSPTSFVLARA